MKRLPLDQESLVRLCRRHHIVRLSLFGSVLKGKDRPDSDVDLLHVVVVVNLSEKRLSVITTYEPDPSQWSTPHTRRQP